MISIAGQRLTVAGEKFRFWNSQEPFKMFSVNQTNMRFAEMTLEERLIKREALFNISSPEMDALLKRHEFAIGISERFWICCEMSDLCIKLAIQAIRDAYPDWTKNEVMVEYFQWACFPQPLPPGAVEHIMKRPYED